MALKRINKVISWASLSPITPERSVVWMRKAWVVWLAVQ